jgi:hypothetical protein
VRYDRQPPDAGNTLGINRSGLFFPLSGHERPRLRGTVTVWAARRTALERRTLYDYRRKRDYGNPLLAESLADLKEKLGNILVAYNTTKSRFTAGI